MQRCFLTYLLASLILLAWSPASLDGQTQTGSAPSENGLNLEKLNQVIVEHETLLAKYPESDFVPTVLMQLAQLYIRQATLLYQQRMEEYDRQLDAFEGGRESVEPVLPTLNLQKAIEHLHRLVTGYPQAAGRDKALYMLAMSHLQQGEAGNAQSYFEQIVRDYPQSGLANESHFRIGEYYFDQREYTKAIQHYQPLLKQWNSSYFDMALYKLGWSFYNLNNYGDAISTFVFLLEDMALADRTSSQSLSKSKTDLSDEAIAYIASCYTEYGGTEAARQFLADRIDKPYALPILLKMAELYQKRGYHPEAIQVGEAILSLYPAYENAPAIYQQIVDNYEAEDHKDEANAVRERIVAQFGPGGEWLQKNPQPERSEAALGFARGELRRLGAYYQAEAEKRERVRYYQLAVEKYQQYLDKFPDAEDGSRIQYYQAECYYALGELRNAAGAYQRVVARDDTSQFRHDAAYNRILCFDQLLDTDQPVDSVALDLDHFIAGGGLPVCITHLSEIELLRACNEFLQLFPASAMTDQVLMKFAGTLHEIRHYEAAIKVYKKVIDAGPDNPYHLSAAMNTGQCYFDAGLFDQAGVWFSTVIENYPDSSRFLDKAKKLAALAKFKRAERLGEKGQADDAASLLLEVARSAQDLGLRDRAWYEAAIQYQKLNQLRDAAEALEELAAADPPSAMADEALYKAAGFREMNEEWLVAADDYLTLADRHPKSPLVTRALKNAALCQENDQDWIAALRTYTRFIDQFPDSIEETIECLCRGGEMAQKLGRVDDARSHFKRAVGLYKNIADPNRISDVFYVAQAQFSLGELLFTEYCALDLKPPFDKSLKRKAAKFNEVFQLYQQVLEYPVADWYTAATCRIGMCFENFFDAFMSSPPPENLIGAELERYRSRIAGTAEPYRARAIETYRKIIDQAQANQIENTWVAESRKHLEGLTQGSNPPPAAETGPEAKSQGPTGAANE